MRMRLPLLFAILLGASSTWAGPILIASPDGGIRFVVRLDKDGIPEYDVQYRGVMLVEHSRLTLGFMGSGVFGPGIGKLKTVITEGADDYALVVGKTRAVHDRY